MEPAFWFAISMIIFLIIVFIVFVVNAVYYNKIKNGNFSNGDIPISYNEANALFWTNVILAIITLIGLGGASYIAYVTSRPVAAVAVAATAPLLAPPPPIVSTIGNEYGACPLPNPNMVRTEALIV